MGSPVIDELTPEALQLRRHLRARFLDLRDHAGQRLTVAEANYLVDQQVEWRQLKALLDDGCNLETARAILL